MSRNRFIGQFLFVYVRGRVKCKSWSWSAEKGNAWNDQFNDIKVSNNLFNVSSCIYTVESWWLIINLRVMTPLRVPSKSFRVTHTLDVYGVFSVIIIMIIAIETAFFMMITRQSKLRNWLEIWLSSNMIGTEFYRILPKKNQGLTK